MEKTQFEVLLCLYKQCKHHTRDAFLTRVTRRCGRTEYFEVKVGLHQGYVLSALLFIIIMDVLAEKARTKTPWATYMLGNAIRR